jgi:hypothetical protein
MMGEDKDRQEEREDLVGEGALHHRRELNGTGSSVAISAEHPVATRQAPSFFQIPDFSRLITHFVLWYYCFTLLK